MKHRVLLILLVVVLTAGISSWELGLIRLTEKDEKESLQLVSGDSYRDWEKLFAESDFMLEGEDLTVPAWKISQLPDDLAKVKDVKERKYIFLRIILAGAYHANYRLLEAREKLSQLEAKFLQEKLTPDNRIWLKNKFVTYEVNGTSRREKITNLKRKLDIIPLSLVLAQAACESGWGTSRFTTEANNIFGEWTFAQQEAGVVPKERPVGADYKIKQFSTIQASIRSYLLNLNSHPAYKKFRDLRWNCRQEGETLDSLKLVEGLINYSEQEELYIKKIKDIITGDDLRRFDKLLAREGD
jgi:Bax protein